MAATASPAIRIQLPYGGGFQKPRRIVIHSMAEFIKCDAATAAEMGILPGDYHAYRWLDNSKLSAHSLITPEGGNIRARGDNEGAWHAKGFNSDSLGIEFLVPGTFDYAGFIAEIKTDYVTPQAYNSGLRQVAEWLQLFQIDEITTHAAIDPARKTDPGTGFPLSRFLGDL